MRGVKKRIGKVWNTRAYVSLLFVFISIRLRSQTHTRNCSFVSLLFSVYFFCECMSFFCHIFHLSCYPPLILLTIDQNRSSTMAKKNKPKKYILHLLYTYIHIFIHSSTYSIAHFRYSISIRVFSVGWTFFFRWSNSFYVCMYVRFFIFLLSNDIQKKKKLELVWNILLNYPIALSPTSFPLPLRLAAAFRFMRKLICESVRRNWVSSQNSSSLFKVPI